jgi:hypothetical protein
MHLDEYLKSQFGITNKTIPLNKYVKLKSPLAKHSDNISIFYKGDIAFITDFYTGEKFIWKSNSHIKKSKDLNDYQYKIYNNEIKKQEYETLSNEDKISFINSEWNNMKSLQYQTPYMKRKSMIVFDDFKYHYGKLAIPIYNINHIITGIQFINNEDTNNKQFKKSSKVEYGFYPIPNTSFKGVETLFFVEGIATGNMLYLLLAGFVEHFKVIVCFTASNINKVVSIFKPYGVKTIIVADNDNKIISPCTDVIKITHIDNIPLDDGDDILDAVNKFGCEKIIRQLKINMI